MKLKVEENSMLIWYPKIKDLPIPQPQTLIMILDDSEVEALNNEQLPDSVTQKVRIASERLGYPVFLRTDLASGKHSWKKSCFVPNGKDLGKHILEVVEFNLIADILGLDFKALVIRKYIHMDSKFTAFYGKLPVNPERRYFIDKGKLICHHPYWIEDAISSSNALCSKPDWKKLLAQMNIETKCEIEFLTNYANMVAEHFKDYWSIDFCRGRDQKWYLIDMAKGEKSCHPDCPLINKKGGLS